MTGHMYMPEVVGPGVALFDYDNDGDLDVFLVQGEDVFEPGADGLPRPPRDPGVRGRLFRNDLDLLPDGTRRLHFTDVTAASRIEARGQGLGAAAADYDADGFVDLYLTYYGHNQMWHNDGDGTFTDVTARTGTDDPRWSTSAAFLDYDRDGWLDLFVASYVDFTFGSNKSCVSPSGRPDYCGPQVYAGTPDRLFRNRGDGTFEDASGKAGLLGSPGPGLGVVTGDFDGDGWPDVYVANDLKPNFLWINQRNGRFQEEGLMTGTSVDGEGRAQASMGVDAEDVDGDGDLDLFMTHLDTEHATLYRNSGKGLFDDASTPAGIGPLTRGHTGFGTAFLDYDNDGWLDLVVANGAVYTIEAQARAGDPYPFHMPNALYHNLGGGRFEDVTSKGGEGFRESEVSRGLAVGDVDNDGDPDVIVGNNLGPTRLLLNEVGQKRSWVGLRLLDPSGKRDALGARISARLPGGITLWRRVRTDASYLSACDPRVLLGLGDWKGPVTVRTLWPDGRIEEWTGLAAGRYHTLVEGKGRLVAGDR
jgi:enediyne biosynthesis protein E4